MSQQLKRTPLYEEHRRSGGKLVPFAGYEMPVQYGTGILAEHMAVRQRAALFDVSHMGQLEIRGADPLGLVQLVTTNDASLLEVGQAQYTVLCQEDGGSIDDCLVFRFEDHYLIVTNASNHEKDREWIRKFAPRFDVQVVDTSDDTALIAIQGPAAERIVARISDVELSDLPFYRFRAGNLAGHHAVVSRTGYTGEDGFELFLSADAAVDVWRELLAVGDGEGLVPAGLGARDSLRLEMGYILFGNDLDTDHTPLEAGLGWVVKLKKDEFVGRAALVRQKEEGVRKRLVGFRVTERAFPRREYLIRFDGEPAGEVTSGVLSPTLNQGIGMAYVPVEAATPGTPLEVMIRNRAFAAEVVRPPFYRDGSLKR